jgi:hypothetical protein
LTVNILVRNAATIELTGIRRAPRRSEGANEKPRGVNERASAFPRLAAEVGIT